MGEDARPEEDLPELADFFLRRYTQEYRKAVPGFSQAALDALAAYAWPGNIRELENEIQRLVIQSEGEGFVEPEHLSPQLRKVENTRRAVATDVPSANSRANACSTRATSSSRSSTPSKTRRRCWRIWLL